MRLRQRAPRVPVLFWSGLVFQRGGKGGANKLTAPSDPISNFCLRAFIQFCFIGPSETTAVFSTQPLRLASLQGLQVFDFPFEPKGFSPPPPPSTPSDCSDLSVCFHCTRCRALPVTRRDFDTWTGMKPHFGLGSLSAFAHAAA